MAGILPCYDDIMMLMIMIAPSMAMHIFLNPFYLLLLQNWEILSLGLFEYIYPVFF